MEGSNYGIFSYINCDSSFNSSYFRQKGLK